jgi:ribonuclease I
LRKIIGEEPLKLLTVSWHERWTQWKEDQRVFKNKTAEENEYFCVHGQWPAAAGYDK